MNSASAKTKALSNVSLIVFWGFCLSVCFHYYTGKHGYPFNTFLCRRDGSFDDFTNVFQSYTTLENPYKNPNLNIAYGPWSVAIVFLLKNIGWRLQEIILTLSFLTSSYLMLRHFLSKLLKDNPFRIHILSLLALLSYPVIFTADRGNFEMLSFIFVASFAINLDKKQYNKAATAIAIAANVKFYLIVYTLLFLGLRRIKEFALAIGLAIALYGVGFLLLAVLYHQPFSVLPLQLFENIVAYLPSAPTGPANPTQFANIIQHNHSIFAGLASFRVLLQNFSNSSNQALDLGFQSSAIISKLFFAITCSYVVFGRLHLWKRYMICTAAILCSPMISFDYTLLNWFIAAILFIAADEEPRLQSSFIFSLLISLPLIPLNYYVIFGDVNISTLLYPAAILIVTLVLVLEVPITRIRFNHTNSERL
jgi:hypothetical protein